MPGTTPTPSRRPAVATVLAASGTPRAVVLTLHGGRADSLEPSRPWHLSAGRMMAVARVVHRRAAPLGADVWVLRYRYRGWNGDLASPAVDAAWALGRIRRERGDVPVVIVGHSMGGRAALRVAGEAAVVGVVALAPWLPPGEPVRHLAGRRVRILHGTADRWTDPDGSRAFALRAEAAGADVRRADVAGAGHFMLSHLGVWHGLAASLTAELLASAGVGEPVLAARAGDHGDPLHHGLILWDGPVAQRGGGQ